MEVSTRSYAKLPLDRTICSVCPRSVRALTTGNPRIAEAAAREVRRPSHADPLDLC